MPTKKPPVWSVCLTRPQLYAVRSALREYHARLTRECESFEYGDHRTITFDALQKVHAILLDAGGVDDTL